jgi:hypothetical protein
MAGQMRSNKEKKKKPKAEWNKKKKSGPALAPFASAREQIQPDRTHSARKTNRTTSARELGGNFHDLVENRLELD